MDMFSIKKISALEVAKATKNIISNDIASKTGLSNNSVEMRMTVSGNESSASLTISSKGILVLEYNPAYKTTSKSQAYVLADTSMINGVKRIKGGFYNPGAGITAKRVGRKTYPIKPIYGPSIKTLFLQDQDNTMSQVSNYIEEQLKNG